MLKNRDMFPRSEADRREGANFRVLHVVPRGSRQWGGQPRACIDVVRGLANAGIAATLATTVGPGDDMSPLEALDQSVEKRVFERSFPVRFTNSAALQKWLNKSIRNYSAAEIHGLFDFTSIRCALTFQRHGVEYLLRPHCGLDPLDLRKKRLLKMALGPVLMRRVLESARALVFCTAEEQARAHLFGARPATRVAPLPVFSEGGLVDRAESRDQLRIPMDARVILFLSRIDPKKRLDVLLRAVAAARAADPKLMLIIAGGGSNDYVSEIRKLADALGGDAWIKWLGWVSGQQKAVAFGAADLFALPSEYENFGIAVVEALAAGVPVLISKGVQIWREIIEGGGGILADNSIDGVAKAIANWLEDSDLQARMREATRNVARASFAPEVATDKLIEIYREFFGELGSCVKS